MRHNKTSSQLITGILGGMGPEATLECFKSIINQTPAETDQDHLPVIIDNNPRIPDRTEAIIHDGVSPVPLLQKSARRLEKAGAGFIIIPCNTAHYFIDKVEKVVDIPILNMIMATIEKLQPDSIAGLLATSGTIETGVYEKYSRERGNVDIVTPEERDQKIVMEVIYGEKGIKAGYKTKNHKNKLLKVVAGLKKRGAQAIIAGCTEIRLVLSSSDLDNLNLLTPIDIISKKAIQRVI
ncbi:MAG: amino acid racemase [Candidatus Bipolaricaulota bacterium]